MEKQTELKIGDRIKTLDGRWFTVRDSCTYQVWDVLDGTLQKLDRTDYVLWSDDKPDGVFEQIEFVTRMHLPKP